MLVTTAPLASGWTAATYDHPVTHHCDTCGHTVTTDRWVLTGLTGRLCWYCWTETIR